MIIILGLHFLLNLRIITDILFPVLQLLIDFFILHKALCYPSCHHTAVPFFDLKIRRCRRIKNQGHDQRQIASRRDQIRHTIFRTLITPFAQILFQIFRHAGDDELLLRSGQRNIQHADLLRQCRCHRTVSKEIFQQCFFLVSFLQINIINPNAVVIILNNSSGIHQIKLRCCSCEKHHRKLQSLTFMDTHDPYCIHSFISQRCLSKIHLGFFHIFNILYKGKNAMISFSGIIQCTLQQQLQICRTFFSCRHCRHYMIISCFPVNLLQQIIHRQNAGTLPVCFYNVQETGHLFPGIFRYISPGIS